MNGNWNNRSLLWRGLSCELQLTTLLHCYIGCDQLKVWLFCYYLGHSDDMAHKTRSAGGGLNEEDTKEIKKSLEYLTVEVSTITKQQKLIMELMGNIKELQRQNMEKDKKIESLERRLDDLEQYTGLNDVIVTGLEIRPRSYSRAVTSEAAENGGEPTEADVEPVENQVTAFFKNRGISINNEDIEACLPLKWGKNGGNSVIIRFTNRKNKNALLKQGKKLKGSNVYVNEHLTKKNADIAKLGRILRKEKKIQATWTANCKVFIKLNGSPEEAKVLTVRSTEELEKYK